mgnify:CR=1 FL=1
MNEERNIPRRRPRKRRSKLQRFLRRYSPSIILVVLAVCCVSMVIFTVSTVTSLLDNKPTEPQLNANPTQTTVPAGITEAEALEMIKTGWDESQGALYYEWCEGESWHSKNLTLLFQHCDTRFYVP